MDWELSMNIKQEIQKDFLRLQKILRELRFLRYNHLTHADYRKRIEESIKLLGPISEEMKERLDKMSKPAGDYDI